MLWTLHFVYVKIVPKLRCHLQIRRLWELDTSMERPDMWDPVILKYWPFGLLGPTQIPDDRRILFIEAIGRTDFVGTAKSASHTGFFRTRMHATELIVNKIRGLERETGKQWSLLFIMDLDGLCLDFAGLATIVTGPFRCFGQFMTENYVEVFNKFVIVNAPSFVYYLWQILRPLLPTKTANKVRILSSNWKEEIKNFAHPNSIPVHWGGNLTDQYGDDKCGELIKIPDKVPESLYWKPNVNDPRLETLWVPARKVEYVSIQVAEAGSILEWFYITHGDFSFAVYFQTSAEEFELVYPLFTHLCQTVIPEIDRIHCKKPGIYKLAFGNYHAWLRSLKIEYNVAVLRN